MGATVSGFHGLARGRGHTGPKGERRLVPTSDPFSALFSKAVVPPATQEGKRAVGSDIWLGSSAGRGDQWQESRKAENAACCSTRLSRNLYPGQHGHLVCSWNRDTSYPLDLLTLRAAAAGGHGVSGPRPPRLRQRTSPRTPRPSRQHQHQHSQTGQVRGPPIRRPAAKTTNRRRCGGAGGGGRRPYGKGPQSRV